MSAKWKDGRCELADGRKLVVWTGGDGWFSRIDVRGGHDFRSFTTLETESEAQAAAETAAVVGPGYVTGAEAAGSLRAEQARTDAPQTPLEASVAMDGIPTASLGPVVGLDRIDPNAPGASVARDVPHGYRHAHCGECICETMPTTEEAWIMREDGAVLRARVAELERERDAAVAKAANDHVLYQQIIDNTARLVAGMRDAVCAQRDAAVKRAEEAEAQNRKFSDDHQRALRIAYKRTQETQTVEEACAALVSIIETQLRRAEDAEAKLRVEHETSEEAIRLMHADALAARAETTAAESKLARVREALAGVDVAAIRVEVGPDSEWDDVLSAIEAARKECE